MIFYRFQDGNNTWDYYDYPVDELHFVLVRKTKCGYWIKDIRGFSEPRWTSARTRKRYAYLSREAALDSYIKRKEKQIKILTDRLASSKIRLNNAKKIDLKVTPKIEPEILTSAEDVF